MLGPSSVISSRLTMFHKLFPHDKYRYSTLGHSIEQWRGTSSPFTLCSKNLILSCFGLFLITTASFYAGRYSNNSTLSLSHSSSALPRKLFSFYPQLVSNTCNKNPFHAQKPPKPSLSATTEPSAPSPLLPRTQPGPLCSQFKAAFSSIRAWPPKDPPSLFFINSIA